MSCLAARGPSVARAAGPAIRAWCRCQESLALCLQISSVAHKMGDYTCVHSHNCKTIKPKNPNHKCLALASPLKQQVRAMLLPRWSCSLPLVNLPRRNFCSCCNSATGLQYSGNQLVCNSACEKPPPCMPMSCQIGAHACVNAEQLLLADCTPHALLRTPPAAAGRPSCRCHRRPLPPHHSSSSSVRGTGT